MFDKGRGHCGEGGVFLAVSHDSRPKGAAVQRSLMLGVCVYLPRYPLTQNDHVRQGNRWGRDDFLGVSLAFHSKGWSCIASPIFGYPLLMLTHIRRRTTKFVMVRHVGRGISKGPATSLHMHTCEMCRAVCQQ